MLKIQLIDAGKKWLAGGGYAPPELRNTNDSRYIEKIMSMAFDSIMNIDKSVKDEIASEAGQSNWKYDQFTKTFIQPILKDETRNKLYSELPKQIFSINNSQGIRLVSPSKEESTAFLPRKQLGTFLMGDLDCSTLGNIYYTLEGKRIYYSGDIDSCWSSVLMKLAVKFEELEDDDWINIADGETLPIFQAMLQIMAEKLPSDISDDNTPAQKLNIK